MSELNKIALKILSNGKGILAADESNGTMTKRLDSVNIQSTPENRLLFRETLFSAESMADCIGGVILYDETINQSSIVEKRIPDLISNTGVLLDLFTITALHSKIAPSPFIALAIKPQVIFLINLPPVGISLNVNIRVNP